MEIETQPRRRRSLVSLTPLIDVVFILLVFFMLATSFLDWRSIVMDLPGAGSTVAEESPALVVSIHADGALLLEGETVEPNGLARRLSEFMAADPDRQVIVRPDDSVNLQRITQVVEQLQAAGAVRMRLDRGGR